MSKKNNILVINGKEYDAITGLLLSGEQPRPKAKAHPKPVGQKTIPKTTAKTIAKNTKTSAKPKVNKQRKPSKNVAAHTPKPAVTLMRRGLTKPSKSFKRSIKAQAHVDTTARNTPATITIKKSAKNIDNKLLSYAKRIRRSPLIQHFSSVAASDINSLSTTKAAAAQPKAPAKISPQAPPYSKKRKPQTTEELLQYAIAQSTSHEQKPPAKKSRNPLKRKS